MKLPLNNIKKTAFIRIGTDGQIVLTMPYVEMGQGTYTSIESFVDELAAAAKQDPGAPSRRAGWASPGPRASFLR
jgi:CO/xanthine dehydrogenase Mo-binding subunit